MCSGGSRHVTLLILWCSSIILKGFYHLCGFFIIFVAFLFYHHFANLCLQYIFWMLNEYALLKIEHPNNIAIKCV